MGPCPDCGSVPCMCRPCSRVGTPGVTKTGGAPFLLYALISLVLGCEGCASFPTPPSPPNPPPAPATGPCTDYCSLLARDQCPGWDGSYGKDEVQGTDDDAPCVRVCLDFQNQGVYRANEACLKQATTCSAAEACMFGE